MSEMADEDAHRINLELSKSAKLRADVDNEEADALYNKIQIMVEEKDQKPKALKRFSSSAPTIFRVPDRVRSSNPSAFTPRRVSIGPLHKPTDGRPEQMHEQKMTYMHALFSRVAPALQADREKIVRQCTYVMLCRIGEIRACYGMLQEADSLLSNVELATIMVIDGCFILEFLYRCEYGDDTSKDDVEDDLILNCLAARLEVKSDLALIENQIPFFVLEELFSLTVHHLHPAMSLKTLLSDQLLDAFLIAFTPTLWEEASDSKKYDHILGFLQDLCYRPSLNYATSVGEETFYSVSELAKAGVKFEAITDSCNVSLETTPVCSFPMMGSQVCKVARLKMPAMYIHLDFEIFLRNLTAYEMFSTVENHYVTSYVILMNRLMKTAGDVDLLERSKVVTTDFSSHDEVRILFMNLSTNVVTNRFFYEDLVCQLDGHCKEFGPRLRLLLAGGLAKTHANILIMTSWKSAAVVGALVLFVLTVIQTVYTVRSA